MSEIINAINAEKNRQVSNEELLKLTKQAFDNDEVVEFLSGENGYACPLNRFVPANVPTDFGRIINLGIYKFYDETKNEEIVSKFKKAILYLLDGDAVQVWIAFMICWNQIRNEIKSIASFKVSTQDLINKLKKAIINNENNLRKCKEWQGWNQENGLWQEIVRISGIASKDYGVSIL